MIVLFDGFVIPLKKSTKNWNQLRVWNTIQCHEFKKIPKVKISNRNRKKNYIKEQACDLKKINSNSDDEKK